MAPIVELFKPYKVQVIEDCAEGFSGLSYTGKNNKTPVKRFLLKI